MKKNLLFILLLWTALPLLQAQDFLHAEGKSIVSGEGEEVLLRGIGTGNWMIQEGYMMQSSDVAPTMHEFKQKLIETIGEELTDSFYNAWLAWHFTRTDVDSMKAWGFNSVRAALHYKWFTPPVEEEPVPGAITWIDKGFTLVDSLLDWCRDNEMYLILDMHGTPGGQGYEAAISDYDDSKPSLWESQENRDKLVALWRKLAERYANEEWMGAFDLINEPNWSFTEANNAPLWNLYQDITSAVREVDTNHILIIEGNWFANDYSGIPSPWDDNMVYSFHKYWTFNDADALGWMEDIRDTYNVPIWLGESGENSNTWFTNLISLCESKGIGWSWWPVKKPDRNNVLRVVTNPAYTQLITAWDNGTIVNAEDAFTAVMQFAENHKIENCIVQYDVIDAMIRQPHTTETKAFTPHKAGEPVFACHYDLGRNNYAYFDRDTADYHGESLPYITWNRGYGFRNDGVDIESCQDSDPTMGYNVGYTEADEWMKYTLTTDSLAAYTLRIRYASGSTGAAVRFESDDLGITGNIQLPGTNGWQNWETLEIDSVILPAGEQKITLYNVAEGANFNYFSFNDPVPVENVSFHAVFARTSQDGKSVYLDLNKEVTVEVSSINPDELSIFRNNAEMEIDDITLSTSSQRLIITLVDSIYYGDVVKISYEGTTVESNSVKLVSFTNMTVKNNLPVRYILPGKIEAEAFFRNNGFKLEVCEDAGEGFNTAYANAGDYLDYLVNVITADYYAVEYRVATTWSNAQIILLSDISGPFVPLDTIQFSSTGGWQNWTTQSSVAWLNEGRYTLRIKVRQGEHNLNWLRFTRSDALVNSTSSDRFRVYPNPSSDRIHLVWEDEISNPLHISLYTLTGNLVLEDILRAGRQADLNIACLRPGSYLMVLSAEGKAYYPIKIMKF